VTQAGYTRSSSGPGGVATGRGATYSTASTADLSQVADTSPSRPPRRSNTGGDIFYTHINNLYMARGTQQLRRDASETGVCVCGQGDATTAETSRAHDANTETAGDTTRARALGTSLGQDTAPPARSVNGAAPPSAANPPTNNRVQLIDSR